MNPADAFFSLYEGLPRQGPGSESSTSEALRRLGKLSKPVRAVDLGCGSGAATLLLARELASPIIAIDHHQPFLDALVSNAAQEGLRELVQVRLADFTALDDAPRSYDLLWSEGAAYLIGFERALALWRPLLAPAGRAAVTELTWLVDAPSDEPRAFWRRAYPGMTSIEGNCASAQRVGYRVIDTFTLPAEDWWNEYYRPLCRRMANFRATHTVPSTIEAILAETEREMSIVERYTDEFGYVFYLLEVDWNADVSGSEDADDEPVSTQRSSIREPSRIPATPGADVGVASRPPRSNSSAGGAISRRAAIEALDIPVNWDARMSLERDFARIVAELGLARATELLSLLRARIEASIDES
jgi:SAM-dependent methyltransferase